MTEISAVLFAGDHERVARFYREALGLARTAGDQDHSVLRCGGFELVVHRIATPEHDRVDPPARREHAAIRLTFPVDSIAAARAIAATLGGRVDDAPPAWAPPGATFRLGHDPDGNVFALVERTR